MNEKNQGLRHIKKKRSPNFFEFLRKTPQTNQYFKPNSCLFCGPKYDIKQILRRKRKKIRLPKKLVSNCYIGIAREEEKLDSNQPNFFSVKVLLLGV